MYLKYLKLVTKPYLFQENLFFCGLFLVIILCLNTLQV